MISKKSLGIIIASKMYIKYIGVWTLQILIISKRIYERVLYNLIIITLYEFQIYNNTYILKNVKSLIIHLFITIGDYH